ncbi:MAG: hypothetical protein ILP18_10615, partial [Treponema sp.]|nr:hypothetical protein [Treponema sp.]
APGSARPERNKAQAARGREASAASPAQAEQQNAPHPAGEQEPVPPPQRDREKEAGSGSAQSLKRPSNRTADGLDLDALEEELGRILDESVQEALAKQRTSFERDYSRLWDSRSFWRRAAIGEGGAIVACLLGGIFIWNLAK